MDALERSRRLVCSQTSPTDPDETGPQTGSQVITEETRKHEDY